MSTIRPPCEGCGAKLADDYRHWLCPACLDAENDHLLAEVTQ
jgi:hypothetical protein